jgi:hypothetical protein
MAERSFMCCGERGITGFAGDPLEENLLRV